MMIFKQALLFLSAALLCRNHAVAGQEGSEISAGGGLRGAPTTGDRMLKFTREFPPRVGEYCNSHADCPSSPQNSYCGYWAAPFQESLNRHKMCCPGGLDAAGLCVGLPINKKHPYISEYQVLGAPGDFCYSENDCWNGHACAYWSPYDDKKSDRTKRCCPSKNRAVSKSIALNHLRHEYFCTDMSLETQCFQGKEYNKQENWEQGSCREGMECNSSYIGNCRKA